MSKPAAKENERTQRRSGLIKAGRDDRAAKRASIELAIRFRHGDTVVDATARNLSVGGMFIETTAPAPYGTSVVVEVSLPGLTEPSSIPSTVRWTSPQGMGIQFGVMGARETHGLLQIMSQ